MLCLPTPASSQVQPSSIYAMSIWARALPPPGQTGVSVTLYLRTAGAPYASYGSTTVLVGASWAQLSIPAVLIPPGGVQDAGFFINTGGPGTIFLVGVRGRDEACAARARTQPCRSGHARRY